MPVLRYKDGQVDAVLRDLWRDLMNDHRPVRASYALGYIDALHDAGLLPADGQELWEGRIKECPEKDGHQGGRVWCAYCGDVTQVVDSPAESAERVAPDA